MNRLEMIEAVKKLFVADGTEEELDELLDNLVKTVPNSGISDLVYYFDHKHNAEQIVDEALRREGRFRF